MAQAGSWRKRFDTIFSAVWLPVFVVVGTSWLLAPWLAHEHYGTLRLISGEEAWNAGLWFRVADMAAGLLLLVAVWRFRLTKHARWIGWSLAVVAVLSAVDGMFPDVCDLTHQVCATGEAVASATHDVETVVLTVLLAALSLYDALRGHRLASYGFVGLQLAAALVVVSGLASTQGRVVVQYVYECAIIVWLGWFVDGYNPHPPRARLALGVRRVAGVGVLLAGLFAIAAALPHVHVVRELEVMHTGLVPSLLAQHGIIAGVVLLYVSRHILRGERPVLWLVLPVLLSLSLKYAILTPQPAAAGLYGLLFVALVYARGSFDRNVAPPSWASRLQDMGVVLGGVAVALTLAFAVASVTGQQGRVVREVSNMYHYSYRRLQSREERLHQRTEARLRLLFETLLASLGVVVVWSLFRPRSLFVGVEGGGEQAMRSLLAVHSRSSEDYFKLWPEGKAYFVRGRSAIAYRVEGGVAFMLADPVAPTNQARAAALRAFVEFARHHGWVACALLAGERSQPLYEGAGLRTMQVGSSAVIAVGEFKRQTSGDKWWRWQRNRAAKSGWTYERLVPPHSPGLLAELRAVSDAWLGREGRSEQGFALGYFDDGYLQACTVHVLRDAEGQLVAFANQLPTFGRVRQVTVDLIRFVPDAAGAMPALLMHLIEGLDEAVTQTFDLGFVPLAGVDNELARLARRLGSHRFASAGLEQFKNKFRPDWKPEFVAWDGDLLDLARIAAALERLFAVPPR